MESPTVKCNIRDHPDFRQLVEQVSGGLVDTAGHLNDRTPRFRSAQVVPKLELHTVHEADEKTIFKAIYDPEYRIERDREYQQRLEENKARAKALRHDD
jgi:hypothetical protein